MSVKLTVHSANFYLCALIRGWRIGLNVGVIDFSCDKNQHGRLLGAALSKQYSNNIPLIEFKWIGLKLNAFTTFYDLMHETVVVSTFLAVLKKRLTARCPINTILNHLKKAEWIHF